MRTGQEGFSKEIGHAEEDMNSYNSTASDVSELCDNSDANVEEEKLDEQDFDTGSDKSCEGNSQSVLGKRIRYKYYVRLPKVLKRDIRRQYPLMIANVMNSHDFGLFHSFFRTFADRAVTFKLRDLSSVDMNSQDVLSHLFQVEPPPELDYKGYQWIFFYWHVLTTLNPDHIVLVKEAKIISKVGTETSLLVMDITIDFSRMYDIQIVWLLISIFNSMISDSSKNHLEGFVPSVPARIDESADLSYNQMDQYSIYSSNNAEDNELVQNSIIELPHSESSIVSPPFSTVNNANSFRTSLVSVEDIAFHPPDPFQFYQERAGTTMPLLETPQQTSLNLQFTFHLNEYKQIVMLESSKMSITTKDG